MAQQGKVQGCLSGISSFANIISPLIYSPLTGTFKVLTRQKFPETHMFHSTIGSYIVEDHLRKRPSTQGEMLTIDTARAKQAKE